MLDGKFIKEQTIKPSKLNTAGYAPSAAGDFVTLEYFNEHGASLSIQYDDVPLALRDKLNLYSGISAADDPSNSRISISLGGDLKKDTTINTLDKKFEILKGDAHLRMVTSTVFAVGGNGANYAAVQSIKQLSNGAFILGGDFNVWNTLPTGGIVKVARTGALDGTFWANTGSGFDSDVLAIAILPDDKIIVGGYFYEYNGGAFNGICALNADGTLYEEFNLNLAGGFGVDGGYVNCFAVDEVNERIYIGGWFEEFAGETDYTHFIALNFDGTVDTDFMSEVGAFDNEVNHVFVQSDGKIVAGGYFSSVGGNPVPPTLRINVDGTMDTSFNTNVGDANHTSGVYTIRQQSDGKLLISISGSMWDDIALESGYFLRLNADGTFDEEFYLNMGAGVTNWGYPSGGVYAIAVDKDDDSIFISGSFSEFDGNQGYLVRLNADGSYAKSYGDGVLYTGAYGNYDSPIFIDYGDYKNVYIGGYVNADDMGFSPGIVSFAYNTGSIRTVMGAEAINDVVTIGSVPWSYENDVSTNYSHRSLVDKAWVESQATQAWNGLQRSGLRMGLGGEVVLDTQIDMFNYLLKLIGFAGSIVFNPKRPERPRGFSIDEIGEGYVNRVLKIDDGFLIVGSFKGWRGITGGPYSYIVKVDDYGVQDDGFNGAGLELSNEYDSPEISDVAVQSDGKIIIVGTFTSIGEEHHGHIARLNADGTVDDTFTTGEGFDEKVMSVIVDDNDEIFCAGTFTTFNNESSNSICKLEVDGARQEDFEVGSGFRYNGGGLSYVVKIHLLADGKLICAGSFDRYGDTAINSIAKINATTGAVETFSSPLGAGERVTVFDVNPDETKIIVGRGSGAKLVLLNIDGTTDSSFVVGTGLTNSVAWTTPIATGIKFTEDGLSFVVTGPFDTYKGTKYSAGDYGVGAKILKIDIDGDINQDWVDGVGMGYTQAPAEFNPHSLQRLPNGMMLMTLQYQTGFKYRDKSSVENWATQTIPPVFTFNPDNGHVHGGAIEIRNTPLYYGSDYSDQFDDYALVHKKYVDEAISAGGSVTSVFGRTGVITSANGDYTASQITNVAAGGIAATNVQSALNELDTDKENVSNKATDFTTVNNTLYPTTKAVDDYIDALLEDDVVITGIWTVPTASRGTDSHQIATTKFVKEAIDEDVVDLGTVSTGTVTLDLSRRNFRITLGGDVTFDYSNLVPGREYSVKISRTSNSSITWATGKWSAPLGIAPILTTWSSGTVIDILTFKVWNTGDLPVVVITPDIVAI